MASYKNQQHYLTHRGREFHFVSYDGTPANAAKQIQATAPTWYLVAYGKRWEVMAQDASENLGEFERRLVAWLEQNVFGVAATT